MQKHSTLLSITATDDESREPMRLLFFIFSFFFFYSTFSQKIEHPSDSCSLSSSYEALVQRELIGSREFYDHRGRGMFWGSFIRSS